MAENTGFKVYVGMDVTQLQAELQKAQNLLRQFEAQLKKSTNTLEIDMLNREIKTLNGTISQLGTELGKSSKPIDNSAQSLINFSRIAQDAPYGIMGIANNLNPMVESFQRLSATEGGTKKALMAMVDGLSGPAGIGVAIGVASSLAVVFSKQISEAFGGASNKLKGLREELKKLNEDVYKITGAAQSSQLVGAVYSNVASDKSQDINVRKNALKELKKLYTDNKEIQDLEIKDINNYSNNFLIALNNKAAVQKDSIGKEKNYTDALTAANAAYKKLIDERDKLKDKQLATTSQLEKGITTDYLRGQIDAQYIKPLLEAQKDIVKAKDALKRTITDVLKFDTPDDKKEGAKKTTKDPYTEATKDFESSLKAQSTLKSKNIISEQDYFNNLYKIYDDYINKLAKIDTSKAVGKISTLIPDVVKQNERIINEGINKVLAGYKEEPMEEPKDTAIEDAKKQRVEYQKWYSNYLKGIQKTTEKNYEDKKKLTDQEKKDMEDLGMSISQNATGAIMGMWEAMQNGESALDSIGKMLGNLVQQLIQAALQAAIFAGIMSILNPVSAGKGGLGFLGYFGKAFGMAEGGIVTGPTNALIGEGNESEAVMPLSKLNGMLNTTFNAGAMNGSAAGGANGQFVLRGQDLVLALGRSNSALTLRR